jgi:hypothetical protein
MAKQPAPAEVRRKLVGFDEETWHALNLLSRESMKTFQELADEAFRDLLHKYGRPTDLKAALRESARPHAIKSASSRRRHPKSNPNDGATLLLRSPRTSRARRGRGRCGSWSRSLRARCGLPTNPRWQPCHEQ